MLMQRWKCIVWPAFLAAAIMEMVVFALIDPAQLPLAEVYPSLSRSALYTIAFFFFWAITFFASAATALLMLGKDELNGSPNLSFRHRAGH